MSAPFSKNFKLTIAYDGAHYLGWQKTKEGASIEETLQKTLEIILQHPTPLNAASRTDAGVHAMGQTVNFLTKKEITCDLLQKSLNRLLPLDLRVLMVEIAPLDFHATLNCRGKEYHYWICTSPLQLPLLRRTSWHYPNRLNAQAMEKAAKILTGRHDFSAFCNVKTKESYADTIREIDELSFVIHAEGMVQIILKGNRFLYKMARNLSGALAVVGRGQLSPEELLKILASKDRTLAPLTPPAHGLTLFKTF